MTAGNNGAGTPEDDDPFAYLYRSEGGDGGAGGVANGGGQVQQRGVPRTSYNQVTRVGERRYGQGGPQQPPAPANAHYAAPETFPGGAPSRPAPAGHGGRGAHGGGSGPNSRGLLIGAIAVVAVVVIGIAAAMLTNGGDEDPTQPSQAGESAAATAGGDEETGDEPTQKPQAELPKEDAASLRLDGGAVTAKDVKGARSGNGVYVGGMNAPGAAATWTVDVDEPGRYKLYVGYGVPGTDANLTLTVNGKADTRPLNMKNFAGAPQGDWEKGWTKTWQYVTLNKATNTIKLSCEAGNQCDVNLDQVWLARG